VKSHLQNGKRNLKICLEGKMSEKNKNGKAAGDDFLRYHSGK
jgi:hypothetical protein